MAKRTAEQADMYDYAWDLPKKNKAEKAAAIDKVRDYVANAKHCQALSQEVLSQEVLDQVGRCLEHGEDERDDVQDAGVEMIGTVLCKIHQILKDKFEDASKIKTKEMKKEYFEKRLSEVKRNIQQNETENASVTQNYKEAAAIRNTSDERVKKCREERDNLKSEVTTLAAEIKEIETLQQVHFKPIHDRSTSPGSTNWEEHLRECVLFLGKMNLEESLQDAFPPAAQAEKREEFDEDTLRSLEGRFEDYKGKKQKTRDAQMPKYEAAELKLTQAENDNKKCRRNEMRAALNVGKNKQRAKALDTQKKEAEKAVKDFPTSDTEKQTLLNKRDADLKDFQDVHDDYLYLRYRVAEFE